MSQRPSAPKTTRVIGLRFHEYAPKPQDTLDHSAKTQQNVFSFSAQRPSATTSPSNGQDYLTSYFEKLASSTQTAGLETASQGEGFQIMSSWMKKSKKQKFGTQCMFYMRMPQNRADPYPSTQVESLAPAEPFVYPSLAPPALGSVSASCSSLLPSPSSCSPSTPSRDWEGHVGSCVTPPRTESPGHQAPSSYFPALPPLTLSPAATAHHSVGAFPAMPFLNIAQPVQALPQTVATCSPQNHASAFRKVERRGQSPSASPLNAPSGAYSQNSYSGLKRKLEETPEEFSRNVMPRQDYTAGVASWPLYQQAPMPANCFHPSFLSFPSNSMGQPYLSVPFTAQF